jgi:hypothetical protein
VGSIVSVSGNGFFGCSGSLWQFGLFIGDEK